MAVNMIVLLFLVVLSNANVSFSNDMILNSYISCPKKEKQALLLFKKDLIDPTNRLASWDPHHHHPDCCSWFGVVCDNTTGHVISLNLRLPPWDPETDYQSYHMLRLEGKINPCLSNLKELRYLDLSDNSLEGLLPYQLGNLSNLEYLNLGNHHWEGSLYVENLEWLSGLPLLKHLDLSMVNLSRASNWLQVVNRELPYLEELHLPFCELTGGASLLNVNLSSLSVLDLFWNSFTNQMVFGLVSKLNSLIFLSLGGNGFDGPIPNFLRNMTSSLRHLDLSGNRFNSSIPDWLYSFSSLHVLSLSGNQLHGGISGAISNMTSLNELDLSWNDELEGELPRGMGKLCALRSIDLSGMKLINQSISDIFEILLRCSSHVSLELLGFDSCQLSGQLPDLLEPFKNLKKLYLRSNSISGPIPTSLGQLANLEEISIYNNLLEGVVTEKHFVSLTKLRYLDGVANSLVLRVHPNWVPPFQLRHLQLGSWKIGPSFPLWLRSQKYLQYLDISNSSISDTIPNWFWGLSTQISFIIISHNQISGHVLDLSKSLINSGYLDLSFNNFSGPLPRLAVHQGMGIDLSNNHFSGSLSPFLCYQLNGTLSTTILTLANNHLSGEIPDCWVKWPSLEVLHLYGNRFTGKIPSSVGTLRDLQSLSLHNNMLQGEIPLSLKNCTNLVAINLGNNELSGKIPGWLGYGLPNLRLLILRSNRFQGNIPDHLCALNSLQILDIADNNLFGSIPRCIINLTAMVVTAYASRYNDIIYVSISNAIIFESASVVMKSQILEYGNTLNLVRLVDFSSNKFSGEIPKEVTSLCGLQSLNLSGNNLTGRIPEKIGAMVSLENLDLSQNQLSGSIPESMSSMTFLSHLNLSFNNFSGRIPTSSQLQGFNESCYAGNHLCGPPLKDCRGTSKEPDVRNGAKGSGKGHEINWFYVGMSVGFVTGFWCVMGPLVFSGRWRIIYFRFWEEMWWKLSDLCA